MFLLIESFDHVHNYAKAGLVCRNDISADSPYSVILVSSCLHLAQVCYNKYDAAYITPSVVHKTLPSHPQISSFSPLFSFNACMTYVYLLHFHYRCKQGERRE